MSGDLNKKTLRHFYCRDSLWQLFEKMSEEIDRGVDDLVNEAMRMFARDKGYLSSVEDARSTNSRATALRPPPLPPPGRVGSVARANVPPVPPPLPSAEPGTPPLFLIFQNQRFTIDKEQFVIGRGAKSSDLPIRDGNISRRHCAIIRRSGAYYFKDLGSTNGIDFNGTRVDNKKIEEGDVFTVCDYVFRFTFR